MPVQPSTPRPVLLGAASLLAVLLTLALSGCGRIEATVETSQALREAGVRDPVVTIETNAGQQIVTVAYSSQEPGGRGLDREQDVVARTVWTNANVPVDVVRVAPTRGMLGAIPPRAYDRAELTSRFGRRPAALDDEVASNPAIRAGVVITVVIIVLLLGLALFGLYAYFRYRRQRPAAPPWLAGPAYPGWSGADDPSMRGGVYPGSPEWRQAAPSRAGYPQAQPAPGGAEGGSWPAGDQDDAGQSPGGAPRPPGEEPPGDDHPSR